MDKKKIHFGALTFVGGLAMRSTTRHFGALSGLRMGPNGQWTAVTDTGFWVRGSLHRLEDGSPSSLKDVEIAPLLNEQGKPFSHKWLADAESVTFSGASVYVGAEQDSRIIRFDNTAKLLSAASVRITPYFPEGVFGYNNGFEALATFPPAHKYFGRLIAFREGARKGAAVDSPIPGFILQDNNRFPISIVSKNGYRVTDADFLPNGDLLILERLFSMSRGVNVRIRQIEGGSIEPNAVLDGKVIFQAGRGQQVDNMEGISVFSGPDGSTRIGLVSDNNHWRLQRNLYLEFMLVRAN